MSASIYIRPLQIEDADTSFHWRNNPKIWRYTGSRPDHYITNEMETQWLADVLLRENERRFAVCQSADDRYIGNIFFTDIKEGTALVHIFIGDTAFLGGGRAYEATCLVLEEAFFKLGLHTVIAEIKKDNALSLGLSRRSGFVPIGEKGEFVILQFTKEMFENGEHIAANKKLRSSYPKS